ncbi:MAG: tRNA guanosine(34) transglycosylase Tgt [Meiothermus sp.]|nr:tRNA guanosine(34) transglycosylase Tgt [Meiothermus sp.]
MFEFTVQARAGRARNATFQTPHGLVQTPLFMPVGTQGSVKAISPDEIKAIGSQIILGNTYHLLLRPGPERVRRAGGLHGFAAYDGPWLTDSGGFQVMSLGEMRKITERGVTFNSHLNGDKIELTPERSVETQEALGADIIMAFDECPPYPATDEYMRASIERTLRWLERCLKAKTRPDQALFAIAQGGVDLDFRKFSAEATIQFDTPGYAIGGLAVGEPKEGMYPAVELSTRILPEGKPRYLMGVGHPEDLVAAVGLGVDMFDCVYPTRTGRFGYALIDSGRLNLKLTRYLDDLEPIDRECDCYACRHYSRAYLCHLVRAEEMLAARMVSLHNLRYLHRLMEKARAAIVAGDYGEFAQEFAAKRYAGEVPGWFARALQEGGHWD